MGLRAKACQSTRKEWCLPENWSVANYKTPDPARQPGKQGWNAGLCRHRLYPATAPLYYCQVPAFPGQHCLRLYKLPVSHVACSPFWSPISGLGISSDSSFSGLAFPFLSAPSVPPLFHSSGFLPSAPPHPFFFFRPFTSFGVLRLNNHHCTASAFVVSGKKPQDIGNRETETDTQRKKLFAFFLFIFPTVRKSTFFRFFLAILLLHSLLQQIEISKRKEKRTKTPAKKGTKRTKKEKPSEIFNSVFSHRPFPVLFSAVFVLVP